MNQKKKMRRVVKLFAIMETVITLFLGAGKKNRRVPLDREQYVHVLHLLPGRIITPSNKSVQTIPLQDGLLQHWVLALTAQTPDAVPPS